MPSQANAKGEDEFEVQNEIQHLIDEVSQSGCTFIRNGEAHVASQAAEHLKLKWRRGHKYVHSAEDFIDRLATESSWSGEAYLIQCPDAPTLTSHDWLYRKLSQLRDDLNVSDAP
ncbi:hypothetical protein DXV75_13520 [Alteromonas aestuariivivens]|uniref:Uncharacterized protein n=1 Tax=Alteromonas aestuariivivens TaxID=1938339 RepID=A0A3D8M4B2_9ALTE|nr:hypothetical protein DXV75_13520 [Alteromonas aestuariivivens]